ncbi:RMtype1_S_EcoKI-TRD1-CR1_like domain containing protein [Candidatus Nanopelagicaceae bacterium]
MTSIPTGWTIGSIGDVAEVIRGVTYSKSDTLNMGDSESVPLLRATNLEVNQIDFDDLVYIPAKVVKVKQYLKLDDILIAASSGSISVVGKSAQVTRTMGATFGAFCAVLRPFNVNPRYLRYWVQSPSVRDHWSATAKGTNINNLKPSDIMNTEIPLPPLEVQNRLVEKLEKYLSNLDAGTLVAQNLIAQSATLRKTLLMATFSGKLGSESDDV